MKKKYQIGYTLWLMLGLLAVSLLTAEAPGATPISVSGQVVGGFRMLPIEYLDKPIHLTVYRGDYVKFIHKQHDVPKALKIPDLKIETTTHAIPESAPFYKMKKTGRFTLLVGEVKGVIEVIDYDQAHYRELTSAEGIEFIKKGDPMILDVRTPFEYQKGHLENAKLIPVQVLQQRIGELEDYKNRNILIYCATGNRSTVASKILNDQGFTRITNLRRGIVDWHKRGLPIVK